MTVMLKRQRTGAMSGKGMIVTTTFTVHAGLLENVDTIVVKPVRDGSGYKCNRSRVLHAMLQIAAEAGGLLDVDNILSQDTLTDELRRAICARGTR